MVEPGKGGTNSSARGDSATPPTPPSRSELEKKVEDCIQVPMIEEAMLASNSKTYVVDGSKVLARQKEKLTTLIQDSIRESLERVKVSVEKQAKVKGNDQDLWFDEGLYAAYSSIQEELDKLGGGDSKK